MFYWIWITKPGKYPELVEDSILPGFIPDEVLAMMDVRFVKKELGLCTHCEMASHCHVIESRPEDGDSGWRVSPNTGKYCTVLFHDAVKPNWKLEHVA
jgi:hypothetical protein